MERADLRAVIAAHKAEFQRPRVLSIRPGWEIADGSLTGHRAVVVTVEKKGPGHRPRGEVA